MESVEKECIQPVEKECIQPELHIHSKEKPYLYTYKVCSIDVEDTHNLEDVVYAPYSQTKARTWPWLSSFC